MGRIFLCFVLAYAQNQTKAMNSYIFVLLLALGSQMVSSMPTLYNVDNNTNEGEAVMVPVASTVIPLEDLPVFKVGLGFGLGMKDKKPRKPANLKDIQLITAKNQHRFVPAASAGVQELTKEEFDQFNFCIRHKFKMKLSILKYHLTPFFAKLSKLL